MKNSETKNICSLKSINLRAIFAALAFFICLSAAQNAAAATFVVNSSGDLGDANTMKGLCADSTGNCTLRAAIQQANVLTGPDEITFALTTPSIINLKGSDLLITQSLTITGPGARNLIVQNEILPNSTSGNAIFVIRGTANATTVNISGLTVTGGSGGIGFGEGNTLNLSEVTVRDNRTNSNGGGIYNGGGTLNIINSIVSNNSAGTGGGGIFNTGTANIANTTISNNSGGNSNDSGGGINNFFGVLTLNNVTISNNTNGIRTTGGSTNIRNTIVANNTSLTNPDVSGTFTSQGNNLIGKNDGAAASFPAGDPNANGDKVGTAAAPFDPLLGDLKNNGGQTDTRELLTGSPAIDAGNNCVVTAACPANNPSAPLSTDQRGAMRLVDGNSDGTAIVDSGAFELRLTPTAASVTIGGRVTTADGRGIRNVVITITDSSGAIRTAMTTSFGYYRFDDVQAGETYIVTARGKRFTFSQPSQVLNVNDDSTDINFVGYSSGFLRQ